MYVKSGKIKKFENIEELILYFKRILPFAQAMKLQKNVVEILEKSVEILAFGDKKEYIENEIDISIYKNNKFMKSFGLDIFTKEMLEADYYEGF